MTPWSCRQIRFLSSRLTDAASEKYINMYDNVYDNQSSFCIIVLFKWRTTCVLALFSRRTKDTWLRDKCLWYLIVTLRGSLSWIKHGRECCFIPSKCTYKVWHMQDATCTCVGLKIARSPCPSVTRLFGLFTVMQHAGLSGGVMLCLQDVQNFNHLCILPVLFYLVFHLNECLVIHSVVIHQKEI